MSFDKLVSSSVAKKTEEVVFTVQGEKVTFTANELTMTQRIRLSEVDKQGGDTLLHWVVYSILDKDGKRMSFEQASALPEEVLMKFLAAALKVNAEPEKVDKKKGKPKSKR